MGRYRQSLSFLVLVTAATGLSFPFPAHAEEHTELTAEELAEGPMPYSPDPAAIPPEPAATEAEPKNATVVLVGTGASIAVRRDDPAEASGGGYEASAGMGLSADLLGVNDNGNLRAVDFDVQLRGTIAPKKLLPDVKLQAKVRVGLLPARDPKKDEVFTGCGFAPWAVVAFDGRYTHGAENDHVDPSVAAEGGVGYGLLCSEKNMAAVLGLEAIATGEVSRDTNQTLGGRVVAGVGYAASRDVTLMLQGEHSQELSRERGRESNTKIMGAVNILGMYLGTEVSDAREKDAPAGGWDNIQQLQLVIGGAESATKGQ